MPARYLALLSIVLTWGMILAFIAIAAETAHSTPQPIFPKALELGDTIEIVVPGKLG